MARLTSVDGGFVQLTANDDTRACTTRVASGRTWSEARAPTPPPSDKPGATPPGDAYAPLGAIAPVHRKHTTDRPSAPDMVVAATVADDQTGPRALCTTPTHNFTTATHLLGRLAENQQLSIP
ncbi:unnamed protein product [Arctia plantaginis]|uniref:Uncharacterized protein n=1 Tax=Arctia plantaginis TaxID=874455 RepID=A0A8S1AM33_ARCPL|nr:unnamed protein product [Arctia plantaginis]